jgi:hypothetical protein
MRNTKLLVGAIAVVAIGSGVSACGPSTMSAGGKPGSKPGGADTTASAAAAAVLGSSGTGSAGSSAVSGSGSGISTGPGRYILSPMPTGTVWLRRAGHGLQAQVDMFGLTPGSSHQVSIDGPAGHTVRFPALNADSAGRADATLTSAGGGAGLPPFGRLVIRLGISSTDPLAREPIAESGVLPIRPWARSAFALHAVTVDTNGANLGQPAGRTTLTYNASAQTLTVTVTASGLNPGPHAAHIHLGSCQSQGPVKYMLADFVADAGGNIINQTRVVTGVPSVPGPGNWYLNLHQGGMSQILAGGAPTLYFRPMLCTSISGFAVIGGTPSAPASPSPSKTATAPAGPPSTPTPSMTMPASTPATTMPATTPTPVSSASSSPSTAPTSVPTGQPTHW